MIYANIKTNKLHKVICDLVVDTTNGAEERLMVLYKDKQGKKYVCERNEFFEKFNKTDLNKLT